ncbi:MAG: phenylalanine--tRNA ligase subunit alpha [Oscillospiraceae bacterium]|jgi:phenylalanyl-tRNA synthetase alpha chain|nr:phenylalanine--tRNA ligase subunit alpha [Oscillospiraceae bacterium]
MRERIGALLDEARAALDGADTPQSLEALRVQYLGKKGPLSALLRGLGQLSAAERPEAGKWINAARVEMESAFAAREAGVKKAARALALAGETLDVTEPREDYPLGLLHPISTILDELVDLFSGMGYEVVEGPEVEYDLYNFELLNQPRHHPARDAQDTFYIEDNIVLRSHTSPVQARTMLSRKPPIRIISAGRCYRADEADATHSPVFHQIEGLYIDKGVSMSDLKGTLEAFARRVYGPEVNVRFRPSFFPFTEPSAEVDLTCPACKGAGGCRVCKGTGWVEVLGCGMVNPKVLELCGIDSAVYSGFAFGMGLERLAMQRFGIPDMRWLFEGDARMLGAGRGGSAQTEGRRGE